MKTIISKDFPNNFVSTIMRYVNNVNFSILINDIPTENFKPRIRQKGPFIPILSSFVLGVLSGLISKSHLIKKINWFR